MIQNPKLSGTPVHDCIPQKGKCPQGCNQCFFNRPGAYYYPLDDLPLIPVNIGNDIVRMNCGHDSNINLNLVKEAAAKYKHVFFNTSIPKLEHFRRPVVFTANPKEEQSAFLLEYPPSNLMFIRLRVSGTNLRHIDSAIKYYTKLQVPIVLTFMAYYSHTPKVNVTEINQHQFDENLTPITRYTFEHCYIWKKRTLNSYWCATPLFMAAVMSRYVGNHLVSLCGNYTSYFCRDCRNCESYYWQTLKRCRL